MFWEQVRVKPASKSSAGKTLSRADVPEDEWKKFGLAPPIPEVPTKTDPPKKLLLCVLAFFFVPWAPNALFCSLMATFYLYCCENRWF